jgi:hypothetical protein
VGGQRAEYSILFRRKKSFGNFLAGKIRAEEFEIHAKLPVPSHCIQSQSARVRDVEAEYVPTLLGKQGWFPIGTVAKTQMARFLI